MDDAAIFAKKWSRKRRQSSARGGDVRLLRLLWLGGLGFLATAVFATALLSRAPLLRPPAQTAGGVEDAEAEAEATVAIFTAPAPFEGSTGARQARAIESWLRLAPRPPDVVLLTEDPTARAFASRWAPHVTVDSDIDFTYSGEPMFSGMVRRALASAADIVVLVDADVVLLGRVLRALRLVQKFDQDWLITALPRVVPSLPRAEESAILDDDEVESYVRNHGVWDTCEGAQLWAWNGNRGPLHAGVMPPFVYGGGRHNHWLLTEAITSKYRNVMDASEALDIFRVLPGWNPTSVLNSTLNRVWKTGNSWLAATYGSYHFRPLNLSDVSVKLLGCAGGSQWLCMVDTAGGPSSCSPWHTLAALDRRAETGKPWVVSRRPSIRTSWFKDHSGWVQSNAHREVPQSSTSHGEFDFGMEQVTELPSQNKRAFNCSHKPVQPHPTAQCIHPNFEGSMKSELNPSHTMRSLVTRVANLDKVVILAVLGNSYRDMLMSWVCRLKALKLSNFVVAALDDEIFHFATVQGLPVFRNELDMDVSRDDCHFGTNCFQNVTKMKSRTVLEVLKLGYHVLFSDVDVYWFQDPTKELMAFGPGHLVAQTDQWNETAPLNEPRRLNSGFYFAWAEPLTLAAFERIVEHGAKSDMSEQPSFYDTLCGGDAEFTVGNDLCVEPNLKMTVHFLDPVTYPNGAYRTMWTKENVRAACLAQGCRVLHNNWVPGRQNKLKRQIAAGLWDYDAINRSCLRHRGVNGSS